MVFKNKREKRRYQRIWIAEKRLNERWDVFESMLDELVGVVSIINSLKSEVRSLKNTLADYKDIKIQKEGKEMLKRFQEEKKVQREIV